MTRFSAATLTALVLGAGTASLGCGGSGGTPPTASVIAKITGDGQVATVGQPLADSLRVQVTDAGSPSEGTTVTWATTTPGGVVDPTSGPTDADGNASTGWTLGTVSGTQQATATLSGSSMVTFTATGVPDAATTLSKAAGDNQTGTISTQLATPLQAKVSDQFGNGVPEVSVTWVASGGAVSAQTVPTNSAGISPVQVTLGGTPGPVTITATAAVPGGSPLTFNATAEAIPTQAGVRVGNILFASRRNPSVNPAVDTIAQGGTVTWTWINTSGTSHSVQSTGSPSFASSVVKTGNGQSYSVTFPLIAGTYQYDCGVHGTQMTGRIVVR